MAEISQGFRSYLLGEGEEENETQAQSPAPMTARASQEQESDEGRYSSSFVNYLQNEEKQDREISPEGPNDFSFLNEPEGPPQESSLFRAVGTAAADFGRSASRLLFEPSATEKEMARQRAALDPNWSGENLGETLYEMSELPNRDYLDQLGFERGVYEATKFGLEGATMFMPVFGAMRALGGAKRVVDLAKAPVASLTARQQLTTPGRFQRAKARGARAAREARVNPGKFAKDEFLGLAGATHLYAYAEMAFPDNEMASFAAQLLGGAVGPGFGLVRAADRARSGGKAVKGDREWADVGYAAFKSKNEANLMATLRAGFEVEGVSDQEVMRILRGLADDPETADMPVAFNFDNATFRRLYQHVYDNDANFRQEQEVLAREYSSSLLGRLSRMMGSSNANEARVGLQMFETQVRSTVENAMDSARRQIGELAGNFEGNPEELSRQAARLVLDADVPIQNAENVLWEAVGDNPLGTDEYQSVLASLGNFRSKLTDDDRFDFQNTFRRFERALGGELDPDDAPSVQDLVKLKKKAGSEATVAYRAGDAAKGERFAAVERDLREMLMGMEGTGPEYQAAVTFSRQVKDVRDVDVINKVRQGKLSEDQFLERAFSINRRAKNLTEMRQIRAAAVEPEFRINPETGRPEVSLTEATLGPQMYSTQEQFIRANLGELVDPTTGKVSRTRLDRFRTRNQDFMNDFPAVARDLEELDSAQALVNDVLTPAQAATKQHFGRASFALMLGNQNPEEAMSRIFRSADAATNISDLAAGARASGDSAVEGMRSAFFVSARNQATNKDTGGLDFEKMRSYLETPVSDGQASPFQIMKDEGLVSAEEIRQWDRILDEGIRIQRVVENREGIENPFANINFFQKFVVRLGGMDLVQGVRRRLGMDGGAHELAVSQQAGNAANMLLDKLNSGSALKLARLMSEKPSVAVDMMERNLRTPEDAYNLGARLNFYAINAGYGLLFDLEDEEPYDPLRDFSFLNEDED